MLQANVQAISRDMPVSCPMCKGGKLDMCVDTIMYGAILHCDKCSFNGNIIYYLLKKYNDLNSKECQDFILERDWLPSTALGHNLHINAATQRDAEAVTRWWAETREQTVTFRRKRMFQFLKRLGVEHSFCTTDEWVTGLGQLCGCTTVERLREVTDDKLPPTGRSTVMVVPLYDAYERISSMFVQGSNFTRVIRMPYCVSGGIALPTVGIARKTLMLTHDLQLALSLQRQFFVHGMQPGPVAFVPAECGLPLGNLAADGIALWAPTIGFDELRRLQDVPNILLSTYDGDVEATGDPFTTISRVAASAEPWEHGVLNMICQENNEERSPLAEACVASGAHTRITAVCSSEVERIFANVVFGTMPSAGESVDVANGRLCAVENSYWFSPNSCQFSYVLAANFVLELTAVVDSPKKQVYSGRLVIENSVYTFSSDALGIEKRFLSTIKGIVAFNGGRESVYMSHLTTPAGLLQAAEVLSKPTKAYVPDTVTWHNDVLVLPNAVISPGLVENAENGLLDVPGKGIYGSTCDGIHEFKTKAEYLLPIFLVLADIVGKITRKKTAEPAKLLCVTQVTDIDCTVRLADFLIEQLGLWSVIDKAGKTVNGRKKYLHALPRVCSHGPLVSPACFNKTMLTHNNIIAIMQETDSLMMEKIEHLHAGVVGGLLADDMPALQALVADGIACSYKLNDLNDLLRGVHGLMLACDSAYPELLEAEAWLLMNAGT